MILNVDEILNKADKAGNPMEYLRKHAPDNPAIAAMLRFNFEDTGFPKDLETGVPVGYKYDPREPVGLSVTALVRELNMLRTLERTDLPPKTKKRIYVQLLEALHFGEANILMFAKDKALHEIYPWIEPL